MFHDIFYKICVIFLILIYEIEGKSRRRLNRVGIQPDPPLKPFTNTSSIYISYSNFLKGFINTQGLFNRFAPIPSSDIYVGFMDSAVETGFLNNRNEVSAFMAHVLVSSKGFTQAKENDRSIVKRSYFRRGYLGIKGREEYKSASLDLFQDHRLLEVPELVLQNEQINWKVSLWKWKNVLDNEPCKPRSLYSNFSDITAGLLSQQCDIVHRVYTILKKEWDPNSKPFEGCLKKLK